MSQASKCPEFRLARSDSKDPLTTCQGLKVNGQRCRRTVASVSSASSKTEANKDTTAAPFCWQHLDQAVPARGPAMPKPKLRERSSVDTLVERVGLMSVDNNRRPKESVGRRRNDHEGPAEHGTQQSRRYNELPPSSVNTSRKQWSRPKSADGWRKTTGRKLVCFLTGRDYDKDIPASRVRPPTSHHYANSGNGLHTVCMPSTPPSKSKRQSEDPTVFKPRRSSFSMTHGHGRHESSHLLNPHQSPVIRKHCHSSPGTPNSATSQTQSLLAWIPPTLSPKTTSKLLQKLSEPFSKDEEPGYIYLCWVTPMAGLQHSPPSAEVASSLIPAPQDGGRANGANSTGDIMRSAGVTPTKQRNSSQKSQRTPETIILKIGRTANVHGRLNQWSQQCAHHLTLMRYYPYAPPTSRDGRSSHTRTFSHGSPSPQTSSIPSITEKIPATHRVEALVLTELSDLMVPFYEPCSSCGKKHKEWFEVRATEEQLRAVDECVRRWVRWSQITVNSTSGTRFDHS